MIDFQNKKVFKLSKSKEKNIPKDIIELLVQMNRLSDIIALYETTLYLQANVLLHAMYKESLAQRKILLLCHILKFKLSQLKLQEL